MSEPVSNEPIWRRPFEEASALGLRVAVVDSASRLLAHANLTSHLICDDSALLGHKWMEFVEPADVPTIRAAFAGAGPRSSVVYRQLCQIDGRPVHCRISLVNVWLGSAWLCYGAVEPVPARPLLQELGG